MVNRPFAMALGTGGATSTPRTGHRQVRRYVGRRCTIRISSTFQSICSQVSSPDGA